MLGYLLTAATVLLISLQSVFQKQFTTKSSGKASIFLFPMISTGTSIVFFSAMEAFRPQFSTELLAYAIPFGVFFAVTLVGNISAIKYGPMSLTMLIVSYSLVIPMMYGAFVLRERVSVVAMVGIVLLCISLFLTNYSKGKKLDISLRWVVSVAVTFVSNGICSTIQKVQQQDFGGAYKSEFMIISMGIVFVLMLSMILTKDRANFAEIGKCAPYALLFGVSNATANLLVMFLTGLIPNMILFPLISAGGIVVGYFFATLIYRERLTKLQNLGYIFGTLSVVLLNL